MLFFLLALAALSSVAVSYDPDPSNTYLVFDQMWVPESCYTYKSSFCDTHPGHMNNTIHGIWPDAYSGTNPGYCSNRALKTSDLLGIEAQMNVQWPSYAGANFKFWQHEWERHGTCYTLMPDPKAFFSLALKWQAQFSMDDILARNNLQRGVNYPIGTVLDVIQRNTWGKKMYITCKGGYYVAEFRWCFDWYQNPIDCKDSSNSCSSTVKFI